MAREFSVLIERDAEGYYVASVPALRGCHTQATSLDELMVRLQYAPHLAQGQPWVGHVHQAQRAHGQVERAIVQRQRFRPHGLGAHVGQPGCGGVVARCLVNTTVS
jgi:hypothetical protein